MKRILIALCCLLMLASLAACTRAGAAETGETASPAGVETAAEPTAAPTPRLEPLAPVTPDPAEVMAASQTDAQALKGQRPASDTDAELDEDAYETARSLKGRTAEELFEAIGEPTGDARYAASCLTEGAEDGMLFYDGFYVWTLRTESEEIVRDVYLTE